MNQQKVVLLSRDFLWISREMRMKYGVVVVEAYGFTPNGERHLVLKGVAGWYEVMLEAGVLIKS